LMDSIDGFDAHVFYVQEQKFIDLYLFFLIWWPWPHDLNLVILVDGLNPHELNLMFWIWCFDWWFWCSCFQFLMSINSSWFRFDVLG
jgi:hypothetical protein